MPTPPSERELLIAAKETSLGPDGRTRPTERAREAAAALIKKHQRAVWQCVHYMAPASRDAAEDLFQEGVVGLLEAIKRFDLDRRTPAGTPPKFLTYALSWIRMRVQRGVQSAYRSSTEILDHELDSYCADEPSDDPTVDLLAMLPGEERELIGYLYGIGGQPLLRKKELAARMNVTTQAIQVREKAALARLRRLILIPPEGK